MQEKVQEQESQGLENFATSPVVTEIQLQEQQEEPGKEATEVMPSGKKVLIIPSGEEEERPRATVVFRRVKAKDLSVEQDKEKTEEERIDQIHEQLMLLSRMTRKKQIKVDECALKMQEAERKVEKGDEAYKELMNEFTQAQENYRHTQEENKHLQSALEQKDAELLRVVQQQSIITAETGKLKLALQNITATESSGRNCLADSVRRSIKQTNLFYGVRLQQ